MVGLGDPMATRGLSHGTPRGAEQNHRSPLALRLLVVLATEPFVIRDFTVHIQDDDVGVMKPHEVKSLSRLRSFPRPNTPSLKQRR